MDRADAVAIFAQFLRKVVERIAVFGKDEDLFVLVGDRLIAYHAEELAQFLLGALCLCRARLRQKAVEPGDLL